MVSREGWKKDDEGRGGWKERVFEAKSLGTLKVLLWWEGVERGCCEDECCKGGR